MQLLAPALELLSRPGAAQDSAVFVMLVLQWALCQEFLFLNRGPRMSEHDTQAMCWAIHSTSLFTACQDSNWNCGKAQTQLLVLTPSCHMSLTSRLCSLSGHWLSIQNHWRLLCSLAGCRFLTCVQLIPVAEVFAWLEESTFKSPTCKFQP